MKMDARSLFPQHSIPDLLCFSHSSVPPSAFLGRRRSTTLASSTLGKRPRSSRHSPVLIDEQSHKRPRHIAPGRNDGAPGARQAGPAPWHQNDRFVRKFKRQEFESALAVPRTMSSHFAQFPLGNDVDFPIHPIFRSLSGLIPELYPSLRLATRFLSSRQTLPFFHSLITSPLTLLQFESQYYETPLTHLAPSPYQATGLPDTERDLTIRTMVALAPHINLQMSPNPRLALRWAYTERASPPHCPISL